MATAVEVAEYIVGICIKDKKAITNMQLQKLLYCVQERFLRETREPAFDDSIEAWGFGPVVPTTYYRFSGFGVMPITMMLSTEKLSLRKNDKTIIRSVVKEKLALPIWNLIDEITGDGGVWSRVYKSKGNRAVIPNAEIAAKQ